MSNSYSPIFSCWIYSSAICLATCVGLKLFGVFTYKNLGLISLEIKKSVIFLVESFTSAPKSIANTTLLNNVCVSSFLITNTGISEVRITFSVLDPMKTSLKPLAPCEPITIKSTSLATATSLTKLKVLPSIKTCETDKPFKSGDNDNCDNRSSAARLKKIISGKSNPGCTASIASCGKSIICNKMSSLPVFLAMLVAVCKALPACSEKSVGTNIFFIK